MQTPMSNSKHTPGPWQVDEAWNDYYIVYEKGNIAELVSPTDMNDAEFIANVHLMAAAPELLAALKVLVNELGYMEYAEFDDARAAIAKAEGK